MSDVNNQPTAPAESSPAALPEIPTDPARYAEWRLTGNVTEPVTDPAAGSKKPEGEGAAPSKPKSETAPASEPGDKNQQEPRTPKRKSDAETRLNEILDDLRKAGFTPAELKTFKREAQQQPAKTEPQPAPKAEEAKPPVKPKPTDFQDYDKYQEALDEWQKKTVAYEVQKALAEHNQRTRAEEQQRATQEKLNAAKQRYGDGAGELIVKTAREIGNDAEIPIAVKDIVGGSTVLADLMYTLGSKPEDLAAFIKEAKENPAAAIRRVVLIEKLVIDELGKTPQQPKTEAKPAEGVEAPKGGEGEGTPQRGADGKFVAASEAPAKKVSQAPPPPKTAGGHSGPTPDEVEVAASGDDVRAYINAANRRDIARRKGT
jgi:hypothetical protein